MARLREYVETHKKMLVDRTLLESRARKWVTMGKPWFSGLASGQEYKDFRHAGMTDTGVDEGLSERESPGVLDTQ